MGHVAYRTCNLCEAMCGLAITLERREITRVEGDPDDVLSRGHVCPKGPALKEILDDPDRVRRPLRRTRSGSFEPTSWNSALTEAGDRIAAIQEAHGKDAVATYWGNPTVHNHGAILMSQVLGLVLGTRNKYDSNSADANPKLLACERLFGDMAALTVPDVDRTDFFLMIGANPLASNGSLMSMGDVRGRMKALKERGARLVVVDPRRTETAKTADVHLAIRPGTDAALLLGMLHVLFAKGFVNEDAVGEVATGLAELRAAVTPFSPSRAARVTGIDAEIIQDLARDFATAKSAVAYGRMGICTSLDGTTASWLVEVLNVVTGNFDRPGGMMFPQPAIDLSAVARRLGVSGAGRFKTRVRGLPEVGGQLPVAALAEEIETPGEGQIRGLVTLAGNPASSAPNGDRLARALGKLDFMVSIDLYLNETTRHANLLLPSSPALTRGHYDLVLGALTVRNTVRWSDAVVPSEDETRDDWDILRALSHEVSRARGGVSLAAAAALSMFAGLSSEQVVDMLLRLGPYGDKYLPWKDGISIAKLRENVHGVDLGPMKPCRGEKVRKPGAKVDLAAADVLADIRRIGEELDARAEGLVLIGRRHLRSNNSWMHNCQSLVKGRDRATLMVHPLDAAANGLSDGGQARVKSRVGEVVASVQVTDEVMPGVVSLPHGFGHQPAREHLRVAGELAGANMNSLTDEQRVDPLSGTAVLNATPVTVVPC